MTLSLGGSINDTDTIMTVVGTVPASIEPGYLFRLDDEMLQLVRFAARPITFGTSRAEGALDRNVWRIRRGMQGSVPASHSGETAIDGVVDAFTSGDDEDAPSPFPPGAPSSGMGLRFVSDGFSDSWPMSQGGATISTSVSAEGVRTDAEIANTWHWADLTGQFVVGSITDAEEGQIVVSFGAVTAAAGIGGYTPWPQRVYPFSGTIAGAAAFGIVREDGVVCGFDGTPITDVLQVDDLIHFALTGTVTND